MHVEFPTVFGKRDIGRRELEVDDSFHPWLVLRVGLQGQRPAVARVHDTMTGLFGAFRETSSTTEKVIHLKFLIVFGGGGGNTRERNFKCRLSHK